MKSLLIIAIASLGLASCKKSETITPTPEQGFQAGVFGNKVDVVNVLATDSLQLLNNGFHIQTELRPEQSFYFYGLSLHSGDQLTLIAYPSKVVVKITIE